MSSEATNATEDALQRGPHEYARPEFVTGAFVTREDVRSEIQTMAGPVIESLVRETSAAIADLEEEVDKLKEDVLQPRPHGHSYPEFVTREDARSEIQTMVGPVAESLVQETSAAIDNLRKETAEFADVRWGLIVELVQLTESKLRNEIDKLKEQMNR